MATTRTPRILIVDDDPRLRQLLERYLSEQDFAVKGAGDARQMDAALKRDYYDLIVLDLMLPDEGGLAICQRLRAAHNDIPILMLTAKGDEIDRIIGLEMGADDYLPKPCNPRELLARIRSVLRRRSTLAGDADGESIHFGPFELNPASRTLSRNGEPLALTTGEFAVLHALASRPGETLSRERLSMLTRGRENQPFGRGVDIQISRLRQVLGAEAGKQYIKTVWGEGYVFVADGSGT